MKNQWIYSEYIQTAAAYILHFQSLTFLLLSGAALLFYKYKFNKIRNNCGMCMVGIAFIFATFSLIAGLSSFSNLLSMILDFTVSENKPDLTTVREYVYCQFFLDFFSLLTLTSGFLILKRKQNNEA